MVASSVVSAIVDVKDTIIIFEARDSKLFSWRAFGTGLSGSCRCINPTTAAVIISMNFHYPYIFTVPLQSGLQ